jgi:hypothetical protein
LGLAVGGVLGSVSSSLSLSMLLEDLPTTKHT